MTDTDFIAIGDTVVDEFIRLKEARVHCAVDDDECTICMRWGDKIPFESATLVAGVGNSANAAVSAARLGLSAGLLTDIGADRGGDDVMAALSAEQGLDIGLIKRHPGMSTNHHYVLSFDSERTILVKHEAYPYAFPADLPAPKTLYLSSLGEAEDSYYAAIAAYAEAHPEMLFAFQPGTFQMSMSIERLERIYRRADLFFCNKEEAERILARPAGTDIKELLDALRGLGPKAAIITDGTKGAYASDGSRPLFVPMYPDSRAPFERTGAGDAFASTVASAVALGKPLDEALLWGPVNSMSVVQDIGAQRGLLARAALEQYLADAPAEYRITEIA